MLMGALTSIRPASRARLAALAEQAAAGVEG